MPTETKIQATESLEERLKPAIIILKALSKLNLQKNQRLGYNIDLDMFELELTIEDISDHAYTKRHDKIKYFFETIDLLPVYQKLITRGSVELSLDAIELHHWGSEDTSWQYTNDYNATIKRGKLKGKSKLEDDGIDFLDIKFYEKEIGESFKDCNESLSTDEFYRSINKLRFK